MPAPDGEAYFRSGVIEGVMLRHPHVFHSTRCATKNLRPPIQNSEKYSKWRSAIPNFSFVPVPRAPRRPPRFMPRVTRYARQPMTPNQTLEFKDIEYFLKGLIGTDIHAKCILPVKSLVILPSFRVQSRPLAWHVWNLSPSCKGGTRARSAAPPRCAERRAPEILVHRGPPHDLYRILRSDRPEG